MPISVPAYSFTFAGESGNQPASQLDSNFNTIRNAVNGVALNASDIAGTQVGSYEIRGLLGVNNAGTPNTKYDLAADLVLLRNPSGGLAVRTGVSAITNDVGLAGPAANGRDQAGAFSASSFIHFYYIWDGATLATVSSNIAPPTGPTLPTGYTHWAYATTVRFDGSSHLLGVITRGTWAYYNPLQNVLNAGVATTETAITITGVVPSNALAFRVSCNRTGGTVVTFRVVTGVDFYKEVTGTNETVQIEFPNVGQTLLYLLNAGTNGETVDMSAYKVANGGD